MKRGIFAKELRGRLAISFLLLCLIIYTVYHALGNSAERLTTVPAGRITDTRLLSGNAWLFRDETLLTLPEEGLVNGIADSGAKVGKNAPLAEVWTSDGTENLQERQKELDLVNRAVAILEASLLPENTSLALADGYRGQATSLLFEIRRAIRDGNYREIASLGDEMLVMLNRYGALTGDRAALESALKQAKAERDAYLVGNVKTLTSGESSAYYYGRECVDGFEEIFTEAELEALTAERFSELKRAEAKTPTGTVAGKLCYDYQWHVVAEFPTGAEALFEADTSYRITFSENGEMELALVCERILTAEDGSALVVFRSEVTPSEFEFLRTQAITVTVGVTSGFYLPDQALVTENGELGVYVFEESTVRFRRVSVLYRGDGYVIASETDPTPERESAYLALNDLVITSGKNLYDGRVYS